MPISHLHKPFVYEDFVPELEASELVDAVKIKQNLYDEGRTKVQDYYDRVSTLPLVRDVDKSYANQELNKIFSIIQNNAGSADFSNPQSVRSFIDIAKPLERDQIMNNAIESSAIYKNRLEQLEYIKSKHPEKYSKENEWAFMRDVDDWANDPNAGAKLANKQYVPYTDMTDKYLKLQKDVKADIETKLATQIKTGQISATEVQELTAAKFKEVLNATMTPMELQQLQIHADYQSANTPREAKYKEVYESLVQGYQNSLNFSRIPGIEKHPNSGGRTAQDFANQAKAYKEAMENLVNQDGLVNEDEINRIYSGMLLDDHQNAISSSFSYKQSKTKLYTNPLQMKAMSLSHSLQMEAVKHKNSMEEKGLVYNPTTKTYEKAAWYETVKKANAGKEPKAPTIFNKDSSVINSSIIEKIKNNGSVRYSYTDLYTNFSQGFIDRMARKAGLNPDDEFPKAKVSGVTIKKDPSTNAVSYIVETRDSDGNIKKTAVTDEETTNALQSYLNGNVQYEDEEVSTTNQASATTGTEAALTEEQILESQKEVEDFFSEED